MKGITFGDYHSYDDFKLILGSQEIGSPDIKENKIKIEGADGDLDFTDFFGEPKYENVRHKFNFSTIVPQAEFLSLFSTVKNAIHGKKLRVILDDDPLFYYTGRCFVSKFTNEKGIGIISVECDCEPWKHRTEETVVTTVVAGTAEIVLNNSKKHTVPLVSIDAESNLRIVFKQYNIWDLGSGSYRLPELELAEGKNIVTVTGTGTVSFSYQEGSL